MDSQRGLDSPVISYSIASSSYSNLSSSEPLALIVDNDEDNLAVMQYSLEMIGIKAIAMGNGYDAIEASLIHPFSIVLLDVLMPGLDGFTVLKRLHRNSKYRQVPVIAVTAMVFSNQQKRMLDAGFAACLTKPYLLDELNSLIHRYIRQGG